MKDNKLFGILLSTTFFSSLVFGQINPDSTLLQKLTSKNKLVASHQGDAVHILSSNTIERFTEVYNEHADIIEMDLQLTKDNVPIVFHDEKLNLLTNCSGYIKDKTWAEISQDCRRGGSYKIPSFEEVLLWSSGKIIIDAEFKNQSVIAPAIELIQKYNAYNYVFFQTRNDKMYYETARQLDANVSLIIEATTHEELNWALSLNDENVVAIEVHDSTRAPDQLERIRQSGKLSLQSAWDFSESKNNLFKREFFKASCTGLYAAGIDIAVTDNTKSCVEQLKKINTP